MHLCKQKLNMAGNSLWLLDQALARDLASIHAARP
jgi:hypothetical protein